MGRTYGIDNSFHDYRELFGGTPYSSYGTDLLQIFSPTTTIVGPAIDWDDHRPYARRIGEFYGGAPTALNLYWLNGDTFTTQQPADMSTVKRILFGAHKNELTSQEASILTDAGYQVEDLR